MWGFGVDKGMEYCRKEERSLEEGYRGVHGLIKDRSVIE
jgi:hypothetical protein